MKLYFINSQEDSNEILNTTRKKRIKRIKGNKNTNDIKSIVKKLRQNNMLGNDKILFKDKKKSKTKFFPPKKIKGININNIKNENNINNNNKDNDGEANNKTKVKKKKNKQNKFTPLNNRKKTIKKMSIFRKVEPIKLNYSEINSLKYEDALIKDKRTYIQYYLSLIRTKHIILFIFYADDYNSKIIKVSILIFNLSSYIAVNSLFFSDSTMHKIYTDHGSFNFIYQLPQIIYSAIISGVLNAFIKLLGISEQNVLKLKEKNGLIKNINEIFNKLYMILKIKFIFFCVVSFALLSLFCYYVTCFCGIYRNTQTHLLKDSLFSFITSLITPFGIYLIPGIFRRFGLKKKNKILYGFSKILQII